MSRKAAITVHRPRDEVERLWGSSEYHPEYVSATDAAVTFRDAPGDRGTEIRRRAGRQHGEPGAQDPRRAAGGRARGGARGVKMM
jgi:hypothetical protein